MTWILVRQEAHTLGIGTGNMHASRTGPGPNPLPYFLPFLHCMHACYSCACDNEIDMYTICLVTLRRDETPRKSKIKLVGTMESTDCRY